MISWNLKNLKVQPIALDIGSNTIKMIQLSMNNDKGSVIAAEKVYIDAETNSKAKLRREFIVKSIKRMLSKGNFVGCNVVSCLPDDKLKITSLRLAEAEGDEFEDVLKREVAERFNLDPEKDSINYIFAGSVHQGDEVKNEVILFAADDSTIRDHISMLESAGLRPIAIDIIPCALFRNFIRLHRRQEDKNRSVVFVDIGAHFTTVVFGRGGEVTFIKQIPIGGEKFNMEAASKLGIGLEEVVMLRGKLDKEKSGLELSGQGVLDASTRQVMVDAITSVAEELAKEVSLCFRYYTVTFRGKRIEEAIFSGGGAYESILLDILRKQLTVDIRIAKPLAGFDMEGVDFGSDRRRSKCEWAVAVGLGLKVWDGAVKEKSKS